MFATLGAALAVLQLGMVAGLALRRTRQTIVLWTAVAADSVLVLSSSPPVSIGRVVGPVVATTVLAAATSVLLSAARLPQTQLAAAGQAAGT